MEIKDKEGFSRIKFTNFKIQNEDIQPIFIDLNVEIKLDNFYAKDEITIELSDFEELVNNLTILNQKEKFIFYFQHLDERLRIKFEKQITGNISVNGILKDIQYLNALNFTFEMSTLEISELIRESKDLIDVLL